MRDDDPTVETRTLFSSELKVFVLGDREVDTLSFVSLILDRNVSCYPSWVQGMLRGV